MDNIVKVTGIHIILALFAALLSAGVTLGWFGIKNEILPALIVIVLVYIGGQICQKLYKDDVDGFGQWFWNGILPFLLIWIMVFTIFYNYL